MHPEEWNYIIREANIEDAKNVIEYIKIVSDETDFLISDSSERKFTVKKEKEFLQNIQSSILEKIFLFLLYKLITIEKSNKFYLKYKKYIFKLLTF